MDVSRGIYYGIGSIIKTLNDGHNDYGTISSAIGKKVKSFEESLSIYDSIFKQYLNYNFTTITHTKIEYEPYNVLNKDMSIVGPRPQMQVDFEKYSDDVKKKIYNVRPGLTGIGSIVFRDEEHLISAASKKENPHDFYKRVVAPYKGELEMWYQNNKSSYIDLVIIFLTIWVIIFPKSNLTFKLFKDLPKKQDFQN